MKSSDEILTQLRRTSTILSSLTLRSQHRKSWVVCYVVAFAEISNAEYSRLFISHFSRSLSFPFVPSAHTSSQTSSPDRSSRCSLSFFRRSRFLFVSVYDEEYVQSSQDHSNRSRALLKHHRRAWTSSLLHAFFFDEIVIINSRRCHHYSTMTSELIIQDLSSNETVNSTLTKSKDKFERTKIRNRKRKSCILSSSDTSSKAFIHAVFECFNSCILSKDFERRVLHHRYQQLSHYESRWRRQLTQQSEK